MLKDPDLPPIPEQTHPSPMFWRGLIIGFAIVLIVGLVVLL